MAETTVNTTVSPGTTINLKTDTLPLAAAILEASKLQVSGLNAQAQTQKEIALRPFDPNPLFIVAALGFILWKLLK